MRARVRTLRVTAVALGAVLLTAVATPATAAVAGPPRASLFCDMFPWLCPSTPTQTPTPAPSTTTAPAPKPTSSSTAPSTKPGSGATTPTTGTTPGATPTTGTTPASVAQACDTASAPSGIFGLGSTKAKQAADLVQQCMDARSAAAAAGTPAPAGPTAKFDAAGAAAGQGFLVTGVPTNISASSQTVNGFDYVGVVTLPTAKGNIRALKFTASSVQIDGIKESVTDNGGTMTITAGTTVTLTGNVELYVLEQSGDIFGLIPLTISPDSPPPLVLPYLVFTDVSSKIAYIKADKLTLKRGTINVT